MAIPAYPIPPSPSASPLLPTYAPMTELKTAKPSVMAYLLSNQFIASMGASSLVPLIVLFQDAPSPIWMIYWMGVMLIALAISSSYFGSKDAALVEEYSALQATEDSLRWLRQRVLSQLPDDAKAKLKAILEMAEEIWPRLKDFESEGLIQSDNRAQLKQTLQVFLPQLTTTYLRLPTLYATTFATDGQTPHQLLLAQLATLEAHLSTVRNNVYSYDVQKLRTTGQVVDAYVQSLPPGSA